jgi:hypothetical protein
LIPLVYHEAPQVVLGLCRVVVKHQETNGALVGIDSALPGELGIPCLGNRECVVGNELPLRLPNAQATDLPNGIGGDFPKRHGALFGDRGHEPFSLW